MSSRAHGSSVASGAVVAASIAALVVACNGEFRFDEPANRDGGASSGDTDASVDTGAPPAPPCTSDDACASLKMRCDTSSGRCVACLANADCPSADRKRCDPTLHVCVECDDNVDCGGFDHTVCDTATHRCLTTCSDDPCTTDLSCDANSRLCVECSVNANCAGSPVGPICDQTIGRCVECAGNAQCPAEKPRCDRRSGRCVGCLASSECPAGQACAPTTLTCTTP